MYEKAKKAAWYRYRGSYYGCDSDVRGFALYGYNSGEGFEWEGTET